MIVQLERMDYRWTRIEWIKSLHSTKFQRKSISIRKKSLKIKFRKFGKKINERKSLFCGWRTVFRHKSRNSKRKPSTIFHLPFILLAITSYLFQSTSPRSHLAVSSSRHLVFKYLSTYRIFDLINEDKMWWVWVMHPFVIITS